MSKKNYKITYKFEYKDGRSSTFEVVLDETVSLKPTDSGAKPDWTRLERNQCTNCPLKKETTPHCPIAVNLAEFVDHFKTDKASEEALVQVTTNERVFTKSASVQDGLFSIFGIVMATSGCPIMNFLKPMARFHLPFATHEETIVRSISMHLLSKYFQKKRGQKVEFDLESLDKKYAEVQKVNDGMLARIRSVVSSGDADANAVVILHAFGFLLSSEIKSNLNSIEYLFKE